MSREYRLAEHASQAGKVGAQPIWMLGERGAQPRVVLIHGGSELLSEIGPELGAYARGVLQKRGVEILLNTRVSAVTARQVMIDNGPPIDANTIVTSIGNAPNPVVMDLCKQLGIDAPKIGRGLAWGQ